MYNDRVKFKRKMLEVKQEYENTKDKKLLKDISKYNGKLSDDYKRFG